MARLFFLFGKGVPKPFVDGAGLCPPGRWPVQRRRLPSNEIATKLQKIVLEGLFKFEKGLRSQKDPKDLRHVLLTIAVGRMDKQLFPEELIAEVSPHAQRDKPRARTAPSVPSASQRSAARQ